MDDLLDQIRYELNSSILPQKKLLTAALDFPVGMREQLHSYVYEEILPLGDLALESLDSAITNFAAVGLDIAQLEDSLVDLRRAISWSAKFSGFNWWVRRRQVELGIGEFIVIPGPGSARDFLIERDSSLAKSFESLGSVITLESENRSAIERIRLLTVPQLDGASAYWHPITLGHELAHLKYDEKWLEAQLVSEPVDAQAASEARGWAEQAVRGSASQTPALPAWYAQMRSWLMESACDSALYRFYGDEGANALSAYLTTHSDPKDGHEHPSPTLRLAVLTATSEAQLVQFREPHGASLAGRERKDAYLHFVLHVRERVFEDLDGRGCSFDGSEEVRDAAAQALASGSPPSSLEWPRELVRAAPAAVEAGLVRSLWPSQPCGAGGETAPNDDYDRSAASVRRIDFSVDFLQFSHRFESLAESYVDADADRTDPPALANVYFLSDGGVRTDASLAPGIPSMDLRLGRHFIVFKRNEISSLNSLDAAVGTEQISEAVEIGWGDGFVLHPGEMVLAVTLESVVLDNTCNAQVLSRSSLGRMGLLSATAVHVQPGFSGTLTLELVNLASVPLRLSPGQRIAQVVPAAVCGQPEPYKGKYQHQDWRPRFTALSADWELPTLKAMSEMEEY